jgi:uncharacterized membrane protein
MKISTKRLCRAGVIAALYAALTYAFAPVAFGSLQIRPAEALCILPLFFVEAIPALYVGCLLANLTSPFLLYDLLLGGAVDYVTKPFNTKELLARIAVALRNTTVQTTLLHYDMITLNTVNYAVTVGDEDLKLTRTEYAILKYLMQNSTQVVSKSQLLDHISLDTPDCTESSLKIHVSNLRKKLRDASGKDYIEAVWGIGFKLTK